MDHLIFVTKKCFLSRLASLSFFTVGSAGIWVTPIFAQEDSATSACSLEGPNNCQLFDGSPNRTLSDRSVPDYGILTADDFVPQGDTLHSLCVWGQYINADPQAVVVDCASVAAADSFRVRIYANGEDIPDFPFTESTATSTRTPALMNRDTTDPAPIYKFELVLDSPISGLITDGRAYWLEVSNSSSTPGSPYCFWHWSQLGANSVAGNNYSAKGLDFGYGPFDERVADSAFCVDMDIAPGGMGPVVHPCCQCDGRCAFLVTFAECDQMGGTWNVTLDTCASASCPTGAPANDTCSMMQVLNPGSYVFNTTCAGTELVSPVETELGPAQVGKDLWFSYRHEFNCDVSVTTCWSLLDTVIAVYFDPNNPDVCPCPSDENLGTFLVASDEGCTGAAVGGGGFVQLSTECEPEPFGCYTIRIGGFNGDSGIVELDISCALPGFIPQPPRADPSGILKSRFFSLLFPILGYCGVPSQQVSAFRVILTSLHHVSPPYTGGPSVPFTSFEGQVRWIGPPVQYVESSSNPTPFMASNLQCTPHYQDWSTLELLHVTGSAIVPSSTYLVETVPDACEGFEDTCLVYSEPLTISTTRWGDVEQPYNPPSTTTQPDLGDIGALVNKFRSAPGAPIKARALLVGSDAFGNIIPLRIVGDFDFGHIAACVDAFRGKPYPHTISSCP